MFPGISSALISSTVLRAAHAGVLSQTRRVSEAIPGAADRPQPAIRFGVRLLVSNRKARFAVFAFARSGVQIIGAARRAGLVGAGSPNTVLPSRAMTAL